MKIAPAFVLSPSDFLSPAVRATMGTVVLVKGVYDLTHTGHIRSLWDASQYGDSLVVALADDASVRERKGPSRPILRLDERVAVISSLKMVDYIVAYREISPFHLISMICPDVFCATHFDSLTDHERGALSKLGVLLRQLPRPNERSTTDIIKDILASNTAHEKEVN